MICYPLGLACVCFPLLASATSTTLSSPEKGVLCDQYLCASAKEGVSLPLTQKYLGEQRASTLREQGQFDHTTFTFDNGTYCDITAKKCYVDRYYDENGKHSAESQDATQQLFGDARWLLYPK
ncbi:YcgJ family protein [Providencia alcalifaciens]|uniref:YcgJ family protein n=1 Tax=Providencia alcalifaciens TaxID=126385 RepID=UPI002B052469|nr:YcgJ family protein [Providencia alcalifaciens]